MKLQIIVISIFFTLITYPTSFTIRSIYDLMLEDSNIKFYKCRDPIPFEYKPFPITEQPYWQPNKGCLDQCGIFIIPNGKAYTPLHYAENNKIASYHGSIIYDQHDNLIRELVGTDHPLFLQIQRLNLKKINLKQPKKILGKVVVINDIGSEIYANWMLKVLAKIALLKEHNIEYDWIYILYNHAFMKETLQLLNIDESKVIQPTFDNESIQADELIIPSAPGRYLPMQNDTNYANAHIMTLYTPEWYLAWIRKIFLSIIPARISDHNFCDKVFLSRQDTARKILNEDEVFELFYQKGFKRYTLSKLSVLEQITLFHQARYIVGTHGSNMTNIMFCKPGTHIIELFQNQLDSCYWFVSQQLKLDHHCVKVSPSTPGDRYISTYASLEKIQNYINNNLPNL